MPSGNTWSQLGQNQYVLLDYTKYLNQNDNITAILPRSNSIINGHFTFISSNRSYIELQKYYQALRIFCSASRQNRILETMRLENATCQKYRICKYPVSKAEKLTLLGFQNLCAWLVLDFSYTYSPTLYF